jgi:glycosyltransferase involved in cell wall biosynthesis
VKTVVFNALNSNSGGGLSIRDSYLRLLNCEKLSERYVVFAAKDADLGFLTNTNIEIMELPGIYRKTIMAPFAYLFMLGRMINRIGADVVFNIGDLIVHTGAKQIYLFDWPYALDVYEKVWAGMKNKDWLIRKVKLALLKHSIHRPDIVIAQTDFIKQRLEEKYALRDVRVVHNAVTLDNALVEQELGVKLPEGVCLVCPSVYYPHKNIEILLDVAGLIKAQGLNYRIVTTVNPDTTAAKKFIAAISERGLNGIITNIGHVPLNQMKALYARCDALLMPTLLESFSIVYLEAMKHKLPIFTSKMWFAEAVCGDAAKYFKPFDANDILQTIKEILPNAIAKKALIEAGTSRLSSFQTWEANFARYQKMIAELLVKIRSAA